MRGIFEYEIRRTPKNQSTLRRSPENSGNRHLWALLVQRTEHLLAADLLLSPKYRSSVSQGPPKYVRLRVLDCIYVLSVQ